MRKNIESFGDMANHARYIGIRDNRDSCSEERKRAPQSHGSHVFYRLKIIRQDGSRHRTIELGRVAVEEWKRFMRQCGLIARGWRRLFASISPGAFRLFYFPHANDKVIYEIKSTANS